MHYMNNREAKIDFVGRYLVDNEKITQEQLEEALEHQKIEEKNGKKELLGQILVKMGYTTEEEIARAVAQKHGVPFVSLDNTTIDESALNLISPAIARRYQVLPLYFEKNRLVVAMKHPTDIIALDDLRVLTGYDVKPVMVPDPELNAAIERFIMDVSNVEQVEDYDEDELAEEITAPEEDAERPAIQLANKIFSQAVQASASDIHIEPLERYTRIRFRLDGVLHEILRQPRSIHPSLTSRIKVMTGMDIAERRIPQDGRMTLNVEGKTIDVRVASLPTPYGEKLTLRLLDRSARLINLEELGFPQSRLQKFREIMSLPYGFILVTGPTGSGKSTTLYSALVELNSVEKHIITLEDPIERRLDGINQVQVNYKAGLNFASGLKSFLRNDPDIILVGEVRDQETARISVESALTGHLILATLHTNDAAGAVSRLSDMGIEPYLTSSSLVGVVAQRLLRILCKNCKQPYELNREEILLSAPDFPLEEGEDKITLYRPKGCVRCNQTGYRGRMGVYELLSVSEKIQRLILNQASTQEIKAAAVEEGMITLRQEGLSKVKEGITSLDELLRVII